MSGDEAPTGLAGDGPLTDGPLTDGGLADGALAETLVARAPVGLAVFDAQLRYVAVNDAALAVNGLTRAQLLGRRIGEAFPGPVAATLEQVLAGVLVDGRPVRGLRVRGRPGTDPQREHVWEATAYRLDRPDGTNLGVCLLVADITEDEAGREMGRRAAERLELLGAASVRLGATLDVGQAGDDLAEVVVPALADHLVLDVAEPLLRPESDRRGLGRGRSDSGPEWGWPAGEPRRRGPRLRRLLVRHAPDVDVAGCPWPGLGEVVAYPAGSAPAVALREVHPVAVARAGTDAWAERVGLGPALHVPLVARGRVIGLMTLASSVSGREFGPEDRALVASLAARTALAMDNARLYQLERATAVTLQRSLLPEHLPAVTGAEFAHRYLPGTRDTEVGGDWFDVVPLACGRVAFVVGDVMGRGLRAAAAMGQLRTAVRTLAVLDPLPADLVTHLDDLAQSLEDVSLATCVYAVYDPDTRRCAFASAGHLPPVLVPPQGAAHLLHLPTGVPLGVGGVAFQTTEVTLPDGALLAFYTDGLVESRGRDLAEGLARLIAALTAALTVAAPLEQACDQVLAELGRNEAHDDDVALLLARVGGLPPGVSARLTLAATPTAARRAREFTRQVLGDWGLGHLLDVATLLVSELVTNALRYAQEPVGLRLLRLDALCCEVVDGDSRLPRMREADAWDEGGRGLQLVARLARRWGTRPTPEGKAVWFELPLTPRGR